jgi:hypothetical protein
MSDVSLSDRYDLAKSAGAALGHQALVRAR